MSEDDAKTLGGLKTGQEHIFTRFSSIDKRLDGIEERVGKRLDTIEEDAKTERAAQAVKLDRIEATLNKSAGGLMIVKIVGGGLLAIAIAFWQYITNLPHKGP
jgi:hypothetical protein